MLRWGCAYFGFWRLAVLAGLVKEDGCVAAACGDDAGLRLSMGESSLWLLEPMWALFKDLLLSNSLTTSLLRSHSGAALVDDDDDDDDDDKDDEETTADANLRVKLSMSWLGEGL